MGWWASAVANELTSAIGLVRRRVPPCIVDKGLTLTALEKLETLVAATGATLWIQHEADLLQTLTLAPDFYC